MTIFERVLDALEDLDIPVVRLFYKGNALSYCIFTTINDGDSFIADNENEAETTQFSLTFWNDGSQEDLTRKIKNRLKKAGFIYLDGRDNYDDGFYGFIMEFEGTLWNHELDDEEEIEEEETEEGIV